jgi:ATP-binding cassette subfamily C (CFTR/MRP) protein 1
MDAPSYHHRQKALASTGSFSGYRPLEDLGSHYLDASPAHRQPLCGNVEGWGPLSPFRYDFTPCFIDVWIAIVAVGGVLLGAGTIWWLRKKQEQYKSTQNIHLWIKQSLLAALVVNVLVQLAFQIRSYGSIAIGDFRTWTTIVTILSMLVVFSIQRLEHTRLRNANGVVLFYWLLLIIALAVKLRSLISQQLYAKDLGYFVTYSVGFGLAIVEFAVEWLWPRQFTPEGYEAVEDEDECPMEYATVFSKLTFDWMTPLMKHGYRVFLTDNDLWGLAKSDQTRTTGEQFDNAWHRELKYRPNKPSLWIALWHAYGGPYAVAAIFKVGNDIAQYIQPQLLRLLISFVASYDTAEPQPIVKGAAIAMAMFACAVFQTTMVVWIMF